jgi:hypothetical protein
MSKRVIAFSTVFLAIGWMIWVTIQVWEHRQTLREITHS